ncbi:MAG: cardiolipin synthase [Clostridia bacterium]|nr:cardiolipin synthase [Clostridia bacterium]
MKRFLSKIFSPAGVAILAILLQLLVFFFLMSRFLQALPWVYAFSTAMALFLALHLIQKEGNPETKIAWLVLILLFPVFGAIIYLTFARNRFFPSERKKAKLISMDFQESARLLPSGLDRLCQRYPLWAQDARYLSTVTKTPPYEQTQVTFLPLGEAMFERLLQDLEAAETSIFLEFYIIREGKMWSAIREILIKKAKEGLDVRVMADGFGSAFSLGGSSLTALEKEGVSFCYYNPIHPLLPSRVNSRSHRKICVIDGGIGYLGGINISDSYINADGASRHWLDNGVRLQGHGVFALSLMFLTLWDFERGKAEPYGDFLPPARLLPKTSDGFVQPYADSPYNRENTGKNVYMGLIGRASSYLYITSPYLVPDTTLTNALIRAAKSGVDVRIMTPGTSDSRIVQILTRSYYPTLLRGGVRIYEYTPGMVHAKTMFSDDQAAVVGSINLDYRSLYLMHESAAFLVGCGCIHEIRKDFEENLLKCREIHFEDCKNRWMNRFVRAILRLIAPLM